MQEVTFEVETITPLFLAGADQATAELRAPSFRGEMRYWLRALVGGLVGTGPEGLKTVRDAEAEVFGATDRGSAIQIKISHPEIRPIAFTENISRPGSGHQATGKGYLLWSMRLKRPPRCYIAPNTQFQIHLLTHGTDAMRHKKGIAALWLLTHLGGIGSRSRRCAGSLSIRFKERTVYDFPFDIPADTETLKKQIEQGIAVAKSLYPSTLEQLTPEALFDAISEKTCRIWILQHQRPWNTPEEAMQAIGESLQSYRSTVPLNDRGVFGFPLKGVRGVERRASPLLLRVAELQGNKYVGIAVLFKTRYDDIPMRNYGIIEAWTNEFRGKKEVPL